MIRRSYLRCLVGAKVNSVGKRGSQLRESGLGSVSGVLGSEEVEEAEIESDRDRKRERM